MKIVIHRGTDSNFIDVVDNIVREQSDFVSDKISLTNYANVGEVSTIEALEAVLPYVSSIPKVLSSLCTMLGPSSENSNFGRSFCNALGMHARRNDTQEGANTFLTYSPYLPNIFPGFWSSSVNVDGTVTTFLQNLGASPPGYNTFFAFSQSLSLNLPAFNTSPSKTRVGFKWSEVSLDTRDQLAGPKGRTWANIGQLQNANLLTADGSYARHMTYGIASELGVPALTPPVLPLVKLLSRVVTQQMIFNAGQGLDRVVESGYFFGPNVVLQPTANFDVLVGNANVPQVVNTYCKFAQISFTQYLQLRSTPGHVLQNNIVSQNFFDEMTQAQQAGALVIVPVSSRVVPDFDSLSFVATGFHGGNYELINQSLGGTSVGSPRFIPNISLNAYALPCGFSVFSGTPYTYFLFVSVDNALLLPANSGIVNVANFAAPANWVIPTSTVTGGALRVCEMYLTPSSRTRRVAYQYFEWAAGKLKGTVLANVANKVFRLNNQSESDEGQQNVYSLGYTTRGFYGEAWSHLVPICETHTSANIAIVTNSVTSTPQELTSALPYDADHAILWCTGRDTISPFIDNALFNSYPYIAWAVAIFVKEAIIANSFKFNQSADFACSKPNWELDTVFSNHANIIEPIIPFKSWMLQLYPTTILRFHFRTNPNTPYFNGASVKADNSRNVIWAPSLMPTGCVPDFAKYFSHTMKRNVTSHNLNNGVYQCVRNPGRTRVKFLTTDLTVHVRTLVGGVLIPGYYPVINFFNPNYLGDLGTARDVNLNTVTANYALDELTLRVNNPLTSFETEVPEKLPVERAVVTNTEVIYFKNDSRLKLFQSAVNA